MGASAQIQPPPKAAPPPVPPTSITIGNTRFWYVTEEIKGKVYTIKGAEGVQAQIENPEMLLRADEIDYDEESGDAHASGNVYFRHFARNEQLWASRVVYNTEEQTGKFYDVRGETHPHIVTRPGVLSVNVPFYFEGQWAERIGEKYIVYNGWVTNCSVPNPWWRMKGPRFEIVPHDHAKAYDSVFLLRGIPLFWTPYFYYSKKKEPRKSGFLIPNLVPHSQRGFMIGLGYYWAISQSYDATYRFQDYTSNAFAHHIDFRGKPRENTDFDAIFYGVQDRGQPGVTNPPTYSGASLYVVGRSDLKDGWIARGFANYTSSFRFRQNWSESLAEVVGSEIHSVGFLEKNWSGYTFDVTASNLQNFQSAEIPVTDPVTNQTSLEKNEVLIRKLPELSLQGRDRQISSVLPLWLSFDTSAGLLHRSEPIFSGTTLIERFDTATLTPRVNLEPHLTSAIHLGMFSLVPSVGLTETFYGQSQEPDPANPGIYRVVGTDLVRSAREFSLDLIFPSFERIFNKKTIFGDKLKHVIEPRATYRYVTGIGTDFNRYIRFDETDLLANTNELELSLTNRIYAKRGDVVQEIFTWELSQKRYFDPTFGGALVPGVRNVFTESADLTAYGFLTEPRGTSPVVSLLRASPISGVGIQWQADYDPRYSALVDSFVSVDYRWQKYYISAGNNEIHTRPVIVTPPENQFVLRTGLGDANRRGLNAGLDLHYDYRAAELQSYTAQVTYNTNCCGLSVEYRRIFSSRVPEIRIAFAIANIATLGTLRKQDRIF